VISAALRGWTTAALVAKCEELGLPYAPIGKPADLFDDPHLNASGGLVPLTLPDGRAVKLPALPLTLDGERPPLRHDLAPPGAHNAELARELGVSEAEFAALRAKGVLA
jgi:crotonobetainyl-CoA:carnitine CoA-transferase CaiB-like acyl-CoA transferase